MLNSMRRIFRFRSIQFNGTAVLLDSPHSIPFIQDNHDSSEVYEDNMSNMTYHLFPCFLVYCVIISALVR